MGSTRGRQYAQHTLGGIAVFIYVQATLGGIGGWLDRIFRISQDRQDCILGLETKGHHASLKNPVHPEEILQILSIPLRRKICLLYAHQQFASCQRAAAFLSPNGNCVTNPVLKLPAALAPQPSTAAAGRLLQGGQAACSSSSRQVEPDSPNSISWWKANYLVIPAKTPPRRGYCSISWNGQTALSTTTAIYSRRFTRKVCSSST